MSDPVLETRRKEELRSWVFLAVIMAPVLTFLLVAAYGFVVWMTQLVTGPPRV
jgi:nitrate reductase NapE